MARALREYPYIELNIGEIDGRIDFARVFGRSGPVHVEVGTGKATFLLGQARIHPDVDYLGIEWARKYYRHAVDRMGRWGLTSVRMVRADAGAFIADHVPDNSVDCFHIYFPDPWPKTRHHKRRFVCRANVEQLVRCVRESGQIRIATDHIGYFQQIQKVLAEQVMSLRQIEFAHVSAAAPGELIGTNYERKYVKDSRQIYTITVEKT
jgi:tRNA (guanine-N7-)-methyltransferase